MLNYRQIIYFVKGKILPGFKVPKEALVLDIGSGDKPFWRGDVFLDRLDLTDIQRWTGTGTIKDIGQFVDADINHMPFKDKTFNFSVCLHVLEHVEDPASALDEIMRVSKAGYIESPNGIVETIQPFYSHLWFMYVSEKILIFVRKKKGLDKILLENGKQYGYLLPKIDKPFIGLYWKNKIKYQIIDNLKEEERYYPNKQQITENHGIRYPYITFVKILRALFYKKKVSITLSHLKPHRLK